MFNMYNDFEDEGKCYHGRLMLRCGIQGYFSTENLDKYRADVCPECQANVKQGDYVSIDILEMKRPKV